MNVARKHRVNVEKGRGTRLTRWLSRSTGELWSSNPARAPAGRHSRLGALSCPKRSMRFCRRKYGAPTRRRAARCWAAARCCAGSRAARPPALRAPPRARAQPPTLDYPRRGLALLHPKDVAPKRQAVRAARQTRPNQAPSSAVPMLAAKRHGPTWAAAYRARDRRALLRQWSCACWAARPDRTGETPARISDRARSSRLTLGLCDSPVAHAVLMRCADRRCRLAARAARRRARHEFEIGEPDPDLSAARSALKGASAPKAAPARARQKPAYTIAARARSAARVEQRSQAWLRVGRLRSASRAACCVG